MARSPTSSSRGFVRPVLLGAILALTAASAFAAPGDLGPPDADRRAEASAHLRRGAELIDAEDLEGALAQFEAAYRLVPSPNIFHNLGIVYEGMGRKAVALDYFQRFLGEASRPPPAAREHAQRAVQTLLTEVADLRVEVDLTGATIFVDGRSVGDTPREKPIYLDPGPHHLSVEKPGLGTIHAERLEVSAGQHLRVSVRPTHVPPAAGVVMRVPAAEVMNQTSARVEPSRRSWQRPAAWAAAVATALAAGVFATEIFLQHRHGTDFNDRGCGTTDTDRGGEGCADLLRRANNAEKWAMLSGVTAGALGIGAAVLFWSLPESSGGRTISLRASPSHVGLSWRRRF